MIQLFKDDGRDRVAVRDDTTTTFIMISLCLEQIEEVVCKCDLTDENNFTTHLESIHLLMGVHKAV